MGKRRNISCTPYHEWPKNLSDEITVNISTCPLEKGIEAKTESKHVSKVPEQTAADLTAGLSHRTAAWSSLLQGPCGLEIPLTPMGKGIACHRRRSCDSPRGKPDQRPLAPLVLDFHQFSTQWLHSFR